jgi:hypothetical protein
VLPGGSLETVSDAHPSPEIDGEIRAARVRPRYRLPGESPPAVVHRRCLANSPALKSARWSWARSGTGPGGRAGQARVRAIARSGRIQDGGHPVVDAADEVVRRCRQHDKGPHLFTRDRVASFPIAPRFQRGRGPSWRSRKADSLVWLRAIHRSRQPEGCIGASGRFPESRQAGDRLGLRVVRLAAARRIFPPIRNHAPPQKIERPLAGLVVLANDQQLLGRRVPSPRKVRQPGVAWESLQDCTLSGRWRGHRERANARGHVFEGACRASLA